jgi:hypothetical protein
LVDALRAQGARKRELRGALDSLESSAAHAIEPREIRRQLTGYLKDWRRLLRENTNQGRQVIGRLIVGRITFEPRGDAYVYRATGTVQPMLAGLVHSMASPTGHLDLYQVILRGDTRRAA